MKRFWHWFQALSRFKQIGICVLAAHMILVLGLSICHTCVSRPPPRKAIAIRTTLLPQSLPAKAPITVGSSTQKSLENKKASATQKSQNKELVQKKPITQKPKVAEKKEMKKLPMSSQESSLKKNKSQVLPENSSISRDIQKKSESELLDHIAASLDAIISPTKGDLSSSFSALLPPSIEIQTMSSRDRPSYGETVSAILRGNLDLPEFGKVVATIEIDQWGIVTQCEILDTKSRKNAEFLKKRLQELTFPCFNEFGLSETRVNFTITFNNVENR